MRNSESLSLGHWLYVRCMLYIMVMKRAILRQSMLHKYRRVTVAHFFPTTMTEPLSRRSPLKRSACDRCRSMKLRCEGNESSALSCTRCSQANAKCNTSSAKLPGRPTRKKVQLLETASSIDLRSHPAIFTRDQTMPPMVDMPFPSHENSVTIEDILNSWSLPACNEAGMSNHESHFIN